MAQDGVVRAAGGVVSRRNERGDVAVLSYPGDRDLLAAFAAR
jgi:hypothetical protein